jgi:hypothetical protein
VVVWRGKELGTELQDATERAKRRPTFHRHLVQELSVNYESGKATVDILAVKTSCNLIKQAYIVVAALATSFLGAGQDFRVLPLTERRATTTHSNVLISHPVPSF